MIESFENEEGHAILVAQIVAGGVGINLQCANVAVLFEPQLKPSLEHQAIARLQRMGQERRVVVHRLLAENTLDERVMEILAEKESLFDEYVRESEISEEQLGV